MGSCHRGACSSAQGAVTQGPASDLQEIPIMLFALLAPTVSDVQTTFFGTSAMIHKREGLLLVEPF